MQIFLESVDRGIWDVILNGPFVPVNIVNDVQELFLQRTNKIGQAQASPYHIVRYLLSWPLLG